MADVKIQLIHTQELAILGTIKLWCDVRCGLQSRCDWQKIW